MAQAPQPASEPRKDPRPRRARGKIATVLHQNPDRRYVMANPADTRFGLSKHLEDGWTKIDAKSDKERISCGRVSPDGEVSFEGQVLLWIDKEEYEARIQDAEQIVKARDRQAAAPGGIDNVKAVDGKLARNMNQ